MIEVPFVTHDVADGPLSRSFLSLTKVKRNHDIRHASGDHVYLFAERVKVRFPYSENTFRPGSAGNIVLNVSPELAEVINQVDNYVVTEMQRMYKGEILNNIMITPNTFKMMLKPSINRDAIRVTFDTGQVKILDSQGDEVSSDALTKDTEVDILIEPAFAWIMGQKLGIHWDLRQEVRIKEKEVIPLNGLDDDDCEEGETDCNSRTAASQSSLPSWATSSETRTAGALKASGSTSSLPSWAQEPQPPVPVRTSSLPSWARE